MTDQPTPVWCVKCRKWTDHTLSECPGPDPSRRRPGRLDERADEIHHLLGIGGPYRRPSVPETKARLDRLKRNLGT